MGDSNKNLTEAANDERLPPSRGMAADTPTIAPTRAGTPGGTDKSTESPFFPQFDGYEILKELGRGGMGVVYKARSRKLDRTVALKMILGGKFANEEDVQRFRIEAESAARLDHPGIVPIYDIGEAGGNHFFTMKFVDGQSLATEGEAFRSDPQQAAELMVAVAEAVGHAHQRGVLHRDLKPANILVDADGRPLVTDLGLAKRIGDDSGLTQTGMAMGTPGFMAPEQAQGRRDVTTAADIFSLGAILFWLQTGQAPFQRENAMQTLVATIQEETPSTRSINPEASADLDLICRKAMHRDPTQRYSSTAALSKDLRAWLNGDLISVRAPTAIDIASIWVKKNLRTLLGACLAGVICGFVVGFICNLQILREAAQDEHNLMQLGHGKPTWVTMFGAARFMGDGWQALQFLIVPTVGACAFLNVFLLRPQSREQNIIGGVTMGLTAGVVAFLAGMGWEPMRGSLEHQGRKTLNYLPMRFGWNQPRSENSLNEHCCSDIRDWNRWTSQPGSRWLSRRSPMINRSASSRALGLGSWPPCCSLLPRWSSPTSFRDWRGSEDFEAGIGSRAHSNAAFTAWSFLPFSPSHFFPFRRHSIDAGFAGDHGRGFGRCFEEPELVLAHRS